MSRLSLFPFLLIILLTSSCASMLKSGKQSVVINSEPSDAEVYREDELIGTTPCTYSYDPDHGSSVELRVSKDDHRDINLTVKPVVNGKVAFNNAMLFHLPLLFSKKEAVELYDLGMKEVTLGLIPEMPEVDQQYPFPLADAIVSTSALKGTIDEKPLLRVDREELMRDFSEKSERCLAFVRGAHKTYVEAKYVRPSVKSSEEFLARSNYLVKVKVNSIETNLVERKDYCSGSIAMEVNWKFFDAKEDDELKFELTKKSVYHGFSVRKNRIIAEAAKHAMLMLLSDETLPEKFSGLRMEAVEESKGELLELDASEIITYVEKDDMIANLVRAAATVKTSSGHGSAFLIDNNGHFLTNYHVIDGGGKIKVILDQGLELEAEVVKTNPEMDLALLQVENITMPCMPLGNNEDIKLGQEVYAIGTPVDEQLGQSVSKGILSGKRSLEMMCSKHFI